MDSSTQSWLDGPPASGPIDGYFDILRDPKLPHREHLGLKGPVAAKLAIEALSKFDRSHVAVLQSPTHYVSRLLPFQVFNELDSELFRGVLRGRVHLSWARLSPWVHGRTSDSSRESSRLKIELNKDLFRYRCPPETILEALIHHMTHAYFLVCCGYSGQKHDLDMHDLGHGLEYCTLLYAIQQKLRPHKGPKGQILDLFQCRTGVVRCLGNVVRSPRILGNSVGSSTCTYTLHDLPDQWSCVEHLRSLQALQVKQGESKPGSSPGSADTKMPYPIAQFVHVMNSDMMQLVPVQRNSAAAMSASDCKEFHFEGQAVQVPNSSIGKFPSLVSSFRSRLSQYLIVPPETTEDVFLAFYSFLMKGDYAPALSPSTDYGIQAHGPPKLLPLDEKRIKHLLEDVRVYKLGSALRFDEIKEHALKRLWANTTTQTNPMDAIEEIYQNDANNHESKSIAETSEKKVQGPEWELRRWVSALLSVVVSSSPLQTNLDILSSKDPYKSRFDALRNKGGEFLQDCDAAAALNAKQAAGTPPLYVNPHGFSQPRSFDEAIGYLQRNQHAAGSHRRRSPEAGFDNSRRCSFHFENAPGSGYSSMGTRTPSPSGNGIPHRCGPRSWRNRRTSNHFGGKWWPGYP